MPMHVHREIRRKDTLEHTPGGKCTEVSKGIAQAIYTERAGPSKEGELLPTEEEKLNGSRSARRKHADNLEFSL